ncbi:MAG: S8 family serine peptidase, partial [Deltaproteobacteria bacterium]|nr:S8 family serine peptidase [Deltaproteobacteria bacterium]
ARINGVDERVDVDIAIIDTGVSRYHPDLNFYRGITVSGAGKAGGDDDNGHGSHVAGTAAAIDNGIGVVGVAPGARLWSAKVLNKYGSGTMSGVIAGIDWVTQNANQIEVANMSLGAIGRSDALRLAIGRSVAAGVFYAVAAGNSGQDVYGSDGVFNTYDDFIPAAYPEVAAVSAMADSDGQSGGLGGATSWGADDTLAVFSNFSRSVTSTNPAASPGAAIDLAAPGVSIRSTWKGTGYNTISGTSMASPHVAGSAALYIAGHGKPVDASGVASVRQALIDLGSPQSGPNGFSADKDTNPEPLLDAANL